MSRTTGNAEGCCAVLRTPLKPESEVRTALCPARLSCSCTRTSGVWVVLVTQAERNRVLHGNN